MAGVPRVQEERRSGANPKGTLREMCRVVILARRNCSLALKVIRALGRTRRYTIIVVGDESVHAVRWSRYVEEFRSVGIASDEQDLLSVLGSCADRGERCILLPVNSEDFHFCATRRGRLEDDYQLPPLPPVNALEIAADKWRLYAAARAAGIQMLPTVQLRQIVEEGFEEIPSFPVLLKTRARSGGEGFQVAETRHQLLKMARTCGESGEDFIVQPLIRGVDHSLSVFCVDGEILAYTLWRAVAPGGERFGMPGVIEFVEQPQVLEEGRKAMKALRWSGVCDMDFLVQEDDQRVWLLEINGRFWGTLPACTAAGVNFPWLMCAYAEHGTLPAAVTPPAGFRYARPGAILQCLRRAGPRGWRGWAAGLRHALVDLVRDPAPMVLHQLARRVAGKRRRDRGQPSSAAT